MDVYNELGKGFLEIVYKDALAYEFSRRNISFEREKSYDIKYKNKIGINCKFWRGFSKIQTSYFMIFVQLV